MAAPDKFKGTADAREIAEAISVAVTAVGGTCDQVPVSDGGEGFLDALGGANRTSTVTGPLGDPVDAGWRLARSVAVIEMAAASGLSLVGGAENNDPVAASTYGTGELISAAVDAGARRIVVGAGGSATTDGGLGALRALYPLQRLRGIEIVVGCDVRTRFVDAAEVFASQKGASHTQVEFLRRRLERLAQMYFDEYGIDVGSLEGSGAAGGLAGGLCAIGAELVAGFDIVVDEIALDERISGADLVITGEGFLDAESFDGKVVGGVVALATEVGVPVLVVAGETVPDSAVSNEAVGGRTFSDGVSGNGPEVISLTEMFGRSRSMSDTTACVSDAVSAYLRRR